MYEIKNKRLINLAIAVVLIIAGISIMAMSVNAGTGLITKVNYLSPTTMYTDKGSVAEFGMQLEFSPDLDNKKPQVITYSWLYNWNKSAMLTQSNWKLQQLYSNLYSEPSPLLTDTNPPYYVTSSRFHLYAHPLLSKINLYWKVTVPSTTSINQTWLKVRINYNDGVTNTTYGNYWFKLLVNGNLQFYNIDLSAGPLPSSIDPESTTTHKCTVYNNGTHLVAVGLKETHSIEDSDGDALNASIWSIYFTDLLGNRIFFRTILKASYASFYLVIVAPEEADAPPGAELTVKVTATVLNDSRYGETLSLGGDDTKTSDDFTGDDDETVWYRDYDFWTSYNMIIVYIMLGVILVLIHVTRSKKRSGRKKR